MENMKKIMLKNQLLQDRIKEKIRSAVEAKIKSTQIAISAVTDPKEKY